MQSTVFKTIDPLQPYHRQKWLETVSSNLASRVVAKYLKGEVEHGGDIGSVPMTMILSHAEDEVLDQFSYLAEIRRRLSSGHSYILDAEHRAKLGVVLDICRDLLSGPDVYRDSKIRCIQDNIQQIINSLNQ